MLRTSARPAWAALNEQVNVSTTINPNSISESLSVGSSKRLRGLLDASAIVNSD